MINVVVVDTSAVLDAMLDRTENPEFVTLVSQAKNGKITVVIPEIVLFELVWVLKSRYEKVKQEINRAIYSGQKSIIYFFKLSEIQISELTELGYEIEKDIRHNCTYYISWNSRKRKLN